MSTPRENLTREEAAARAGVVSRPTYAIQLDLTRGDEVFGCATVVRFAAAPGTATFLDCTAREVHRVTVNGRLLPADAVSETRIALTDLAADNEIIVEATMNYLREGRGLHHFRDPSDDVVYLHTQFESFDAHLVFPCFDQPDLKATYAVAVDAPADWVVVSNQPVVESPQDGATGTWTFATTPLLSTYLVAVVAGGYVSVHDTHGDMSLGIYCRRSLLAALDPDEMFEITKQGLDWFAQAFDLPYPFEKYDQLFVPEFAMGAMEHPGCVTFVESYIFRSKVTDSTRERRAETILHEMAHMWFGDLVTMKWWDDLWLNESFATFMSVLCQVSATRFDGSWVTFLDSEKTWAKFQDQLPSTHPIAADMVDMEAVHQNFDGITYAKGAAVLRQLVAWVGQDAFLAGCREYFRAHAWGNAELADFLHALEKASGRDLDGWRDEWLLTTGVNTFDPFIESAAGHYREVAILQRTGDDQPHPRRHRMAVGLYDRGADGVLRRRQRLELDVDGARTEVPELAGQPIADLLLLNDDDLTYAKITLDHFSTATATDHLARLEDPLARALTWSATWDMLRDGDLPGRQFVAMVERNLDSESEIGVLQRLINRAMAAVDRYGDPGNRTLAMSGLATTLRQLIPGAAPGDDRQLSFVRGWAAASRTDEQAMEVRAVLDGELIFDGLAVDTDLRWHLLTSLSASGHATEADIDAELERDPTDLGERHAAAARAVRPDVAAKELAWARLTTEDGLSHTMARELYSGFQRLDQPDVLSAWRDRYFEALPTVFSTRGVEQAVEFAEGTFPHPAADQDLLAVLDDYLAADLDAPQRRTLLEQRDVLVRTLRGRDVDAAAG